MRKEILLKYIHGELPESEQRMVLDWIDQSDANRLYYLNLLNSVADSEIYSAKNIVEISDSEKRDSYERIRKGIEMKNSKKRRLYNSRYSGYAAAAAIVILIALNLFQFSENRSDKAAYEKSMADYDGEMVYRTDKGVKGTVTLPDGSVVELNSDSKIIFPEKFSHGKREVFLEGEAFLDVVKDPEWPMELMTGKGMQITVRGTRFHVKSYPDDDYEEATLFSGAIDIEKKDTRGNVVLKKKMVPLQTMNIKDDFAVELQQPDKAIADTLKKTAWVRGELYFDNTKLDEVFRMLERWHGQRIVVDDTTLFKHRFNAYFGSESMVQIMELMKFTTPIDYRISDNVVYVSRRKTSSR